MVAGLGLPEVGLGLGWVVAFLFVVALLRGSLIPRRTHDDVVHDRDEWRTESRVKDAQITEKDTQLRSLGSLAQTVDMIMTALRTNAGGGG